MSSFTFKWPAGPKDVIVTGSFDNWSQSLPLVKQADGSFELTVPFEKTDKIIYKFVVDGEWLVSPDAKSEADEGGNVNNVVYPDAFTTESVSSKIPEAGGIAVASVPVAKEVIPETKKESEELVPETVPETKEEVEEAAPETKEVVPETKEDLKTTVMPSEENKQATLGEPGIVIPENAEEIKEFKEINTLDPKVLNQETTAAPVIPENAEEIKEFKEVSDVDPKTLNGEAESLPASAGSTKKVKKVVKKVKKETTATTEAPPATATTEETVTESTPEKKVAKPVVEKPKKKKGFFSKLKAALK